MRYVFKGTRFLKSQAKKQSSIFTAIDVTWNESTAGMEKNAKYRNGCSEFN